ncbi:hypothetical protein J5N97_026484 [Dioscorea zingiberensis]|uniref:BHLH domain-containing protein n=1 Tax=Dioscorea zingiberensis TaxID=325984 RepID=A0A9D5C266_9LILI|nr:hypothetical protein J5N97_026484 [Dioscorea zingiberensis]
MDLGEKEKFGLESFQHSGASVDQWQFAIPSVEIVPKTIPSVWSNHTNPGSLRISESWKGGMFLQNNPSLLSCFNGSGFSGMVNAFGVSDSLNQQQNGVKIENQEQKGSFHGVGASSNESGEPEFSGGGGGQEEIHGSGNAAAGGDSSSKELGLKKRKRSNQDDIESETTKENAEIKGKGLQNSPTISAAKQAGKQAKDCSDSPKEDYIHVRARRGQATNSHSLAERVRREKISERMKLLQDLVPGCSKVTGKAVMLDEIINYVQSLQRQVEFLSMKLAAVNPRLDFNIEGILSKDLLQFQGGFPADMTLPQFHPSQQGFIQAGIPAMVNPPDALRKAINAQLNSMNLYKESTSQVPNSWDEELHNVVQMTFSANPSINDKLRDGFPI